MRRIASHYTLVNGELERGIVVEVDDYGTITSISRHDNIDNIASVEFYPGILVPGMVNAHSHLELAYLRGAIAEHTGFAEYSNKFDISLDFAPTLTCFCKLKLGCTSEKCK